MEYDTLSLSTFYPDSLKITGTEQDDKEVRISLKSLTKECKCPKCGKKSNQYHGTYIRTVKDLPLLGKSVKLTINAYEQDCINEDCDVSTFVETFDDFLNYYSRYTERCADFLCTLAIETSCEGASRICKSMGINISGDTIIRLLIKRYEALEQQTVGSVIGVDDFSYKKRNTYGTIIVDEGTHNPIQLLDGRDGEALREWLKNNKHVKVVTRDRASAYAKVISEELPDVMQVADRFHLHQNLLDAVKKALNDVLPATIKIQHKDLSTQADEACKKNRFECG